MNTNQLSIPFRNEVYSYTIANDMQRDLCRLAIPALFNDLLSHVILHSFLGNREWAHVFFSSRSFPINVDLHLKHERSILALIILLPCRRRCLGNKEWKLLSLIKINISIIFFYLYVYILSYFNTSK